MRLGAELVQQAERCAGAVNWQHGAGSEVYAQADDVRGRDAGLREDSGYSLPQDCQIVGRVLQGPVGVEAAAAAGEALVDDAVGVGVDVGGDNLAVGDADEDGPARLGAEVNSDGVLVRHGCLRV